MDSQSAMVLFEGKKIRKVWHKKEWWFSVVDIVESLTNSENPRDYWYKLKTRELESAGIELSTFCLQLKLLAQDGKMRETDCTNTEGAFRIIQSIPSPKAKTVQIMACKNRM
jgi:DNA-damage-inducible protein D